MEWHAIKEEEIIDLLKVDPVTGLSHEEAEKRLSTYGPNELKGGEAPSVLKIFLRQFTNILIIILLIATVLSSLAGEIFDAGLIVLIVIFSAGLGFLQEYRAERAIEALKGMLSPTITVLREGMEVEIETRYLVPGDIIIPEAGDRIPADARLLESHSLMVDEASLTGESLPVEKATGRLPSHRIFPERTNMVFASTVVTYGRGRAVVVSTGMGTELGRIAQEVGSIKEEKTPLEIRTEEIGKWLGIIAFLVCFAVAGLGIVREAISGEVTFEFILTIVMFAVALAVAAVPEALAAIVTGTLAIGMREMAKSNALIRRMPAVEALGSVTVICSDKTGTITKGEMTVRRIYSDGVMADVSGVGYEPVGRFIPEDAPRRFFDLFLAGLLCNDAELHHEEGRWSIKGDTTEGALVVLAVKAGLNVKELRLENQRIEEIPFSSERKRMTTVHIEKGSIKVAYMKGAPEVVLRRCSYEFKNGESLPVDEERRKEIVSIADRMAGEGLRVLALAMRVLDGDVDEVEDRMGFLGLVGMIDPARKEAMEAVRVCRDIRIKPVMITGDHKLTAMAVAREVGIFHEDDTALSGDELDKLTDRELESIVESVSLYARVSPMDKLRIVRAWKKKGHRVAMTGDGVNDAPALKNADIGVAMGITGTEVTKEAADMILADDNFATILKAIERGRWIYDNIKKYLTYLLRANIIEVVVLGGTVVLKGPDYLPLLPAAILYINLVTDGLPALALGIAPPEPDIMKRPPRDPKESVFSLEVRTFILLALIIEGPLFFWVFFSSKDILSGRTELFFLFVFIELIMALNFRSLRYSIFKEPPHRGLIISVIGSIVITLVLVQIPRVRDSFGISMPEIEKIGVAFLIALGVTVSIEITKKILKERTDRYL